MSRDVECTATSEGDMVVTVSCTPAKKEVIGYQVILQLDDPNNKESLYELRVKSSNFSTSVVIGVEREGNYTVIVFAAFNGTGIVGSKVSLFTEIKVGVASTTEGSPVSSTTQVSSSKETTAEFRYVHDYCVLILANAVAVVAVIVSLMTVLFAVLIVFVIVIVFTRWKHMK